MKRLHDLRKQLPSNAKLNIFESTRVKGGVEEKNKKRPSSENGNGDNSGDLGLGGGGN